MVWQAALYLGAWAGHVPAPPVHVHLDTLLLQLGSIVNVVRDVCRHASRSECAWVAYQHDVLVCEVLCCVDSLLCETIWAVLNDSDDG